jgi:hypothetical protein
MSRAYQVGFEAACSDNGKVNIDILPILSKDRMHEILREELKKDGWKEDPETGDLKKQVDGVDVTLPKGSSVAELSLEIEKKGTARSDTDYSQKQTDEIVEKAKKALEESLKEQVSGKLINAEEKVIKSLDEATQRTYVRSLKEKAASMGNIESVSEGTDSSGRPEVTIKISMFS